MATETWNTYNPIIVRPAPRFPAAYKLRYKTANAEELFGGQRIEQVIFERFNSEAGVSEEIAVHWTEAFHWADFDPCGGQVKAVMLRDGVSKTFRAFASGRYLCHEHRVWKEAGIKSGLVAINVGCYGGAWLTRELVKEEVKS